MAPNLYGILGIDSGASAADIKRAYRRLALLWHPDRNRDDPRAAAEFRLVGEAYRVLKDPVKRTRYDRQRSASPPPRGLSRAVGESAHHPPLRPRAQPPTSDHAHHLEARARRRAGRRRNGSRRPAEMLLSGKSPVWQRLRPGRTLWHRWGERLWRWGARLGYWLGKRGPQLAWELVPTPGPHLILDLKMPRWLAARGTECHLPIPGLSQGQPLHLVIPPGVRDGTCLRLPEAVRTGSLRGHLYINILLVP